VLGTERHESRRIDRQLRGRCARQGDRGASKFFISLEDNLMRLFAQPGPIANIMEKSFSEEDELTHPLLNRSIESAQKKVEQQNYAIRKRLLQYDDVLNKQREIIYSLRNEALHAEKPKDLIYDMIKDELEERLENKALFSESGTAGDHEDRQGLLRWVNTHFPIAMAESAVDWTNSETAHASIFSKIEEAYDKKERLQQPDAFKKLERWIVISSLDRHWQDHLTEMDDLRRSVGIRALGQKDPLSEYKKEGFGYFEQMLDNARKQIATSLFRSAVMLERNIIDALQERMKKAQASQPTIGPAQAAASSPEAQQQHLPAQLRMSGGGQSGMNPAARLKPEPIVRDIPKVGRNDPCPCGSGKKYKQCHGG
jgi:preprotein translocase subunit SecA